MMYAFQIWSIINGIMSNTVNHKLRQHDQFTISIANCVMKAFFETKNN